MIEICPTSDIPEDAASTTSTVALLAELPSNLLSSTLNVSTTSIFQSPLCEQPPGLSVSTEVSSQLYPNHVVDSFSLFKELLCSTFLNRQTDLLVDNIKLSFSSEKTLTDSSIVSRSQTVAASSSKPLIAQTPVDKSIVTSETADVRRPSDASCGICKTQHRPSKLDSPRTVPADHNDSTTPVRKRLEIANIAVCSTYTLWKFHRLKVQECRRQKRATKTVPTGRPVDENGQDLQVPPEVDGCLPPATSLGHAENVIRDIALRCERSSNSVTTPPSLCEAIFTTQATMNQTFEQSEPDTTLSRLKPNVAEQNREQYEGDRLLSLCFLSCQRGGGDRSGKLFKKRRKCLTLRLCHTTSSALFHFSTNTENYQQFSEIFLSDSSNRSLIARPARSNSILRVIYFKLICCPPSCDSPTSSRSIPVLLSCDKYAVLSLEKPVFTKTYNCSYFRHCYRQKYTRRRRPRVTTRKRTSFNKDILTRVNDQNSSTTDEATSCLCTPNQTSNTLPVTSSHGTECPCDAGDRKSKALNNETCQTFNPRVFRTQDSSLWSILSWLTTIFVVILIPIMIIYVLDLFYRIIVIPTKILLQLTYRKLVRKPKGVARSRLKRNDFLRSLLYMLVVFVCCVPHDSSTAQASSFPLDPRRLVRSAPAFEDNFNSTDYSRGRICQSIDVRNSVHNLRLLRGCRVIEGFLQIFVETGTSADWDDYSFPELVEVTDYVVLYRNTGPRSLGSLFPNLALIRGHNLLYNYALVVHECTGMQELALYHLTDILRGSVHIMKNPTLCFVDTVNWDLISWTQGSHYIKENRHPNECPICPLNATGGELCMPSIVTPASRPLCVNTTHCQKMCKVECPGRSCYNDGYSCCNAACIGGCSGNSSSDCVGCRKLEFQGTCVDACDATSYSFIDRRCVSNDECQAQPPPITSPDIPVKYWKFVRNEFTGDNVCVLDCPKGYVEKEIPNGPRRTKFECQRCYSGDCEKKCQGSNIESIQKLQQYKECTYIKGSLEIQIQNGANVVKELENNLGMVEVIEGYLKIARSYPIMSLNFFKKLRLIKGETLETNRFALVVLDNQNLMELWDWSKRNVSLRIDKGQVFFHFNPKLCYYHIENLASQAGLNFTETEVPKSSNGDKAACMISKINSTIHVLSHNLAQISWEKFDHYDSRALLSYLIFYKETKYQNVTMYDSRDACGGDGWKMEDYENIENKTSSTLTNERPEDKWITHILTSLKPFTQYAYYVRTYTIATERNGAQSPIQYFMTLPNTPTFPVDLIATSTSHSEIQISWKPPKIPNGNVTHYFIVGYWERDDPKIIQTRNYCLQHIILSGGGTLISRPSTPAPTPSSTTEAGTGSGATLSAKSATAGEECVCGKKDEKSDEDKMKEINRFIEIEFENALQNQVYVKRILYSSEANRRRRDLEGGAENVFPNVKQTNQLIRLSSEEENQTFVTVPSPAGNVTSPDGVFERFEFVVYGATSFLIRNLSHYAKYNIEVQACREVVPDETFDINNSNCSRKSLVTRRTLAKDGVDSINQTSFRLERSNGSWFALWEAPSNPNGLVVAYKIETARQDKSKYSTPDPHCISKAQYDLDGRYDIASSELVAGNYSIRVRAVSLYGEGAWSEKLYFVVQKPSMSDLELTIMIILLVVIILLITLGLVYYRREKVGALLNPSVNPEYIPVYKKDSWEVARSKVTILDELGNGSFGLVCRGVVKDFRNLAELPCAVKLVNENASDRERAEFLNEASVMKAFDAHHVVKLFGVVSEGHPTLVIMELMAGGDLKNYLRSCRPDAEVDLGRSPPTLKRILQMAAEIADGMAYLADKKYVHRDLAARNCMVAEDMTVKVGDFGMTRDIYETEYYRKGSRGFLPVRWMAPESLKDGVFTSCSDVWSYGVVLWEIATLASQPYQGLTNEQVLNWVKGGGILVRPDNCPDRLFALMRRCWQFKPSGRPTFSLLLADLEHELDPSFRQVSYYHSEAAREHQLRLASKAETRTSSTTLDEHIPLRTAEDIEDFSLSSDSSGEEDNIHAVLSQPFSSKQWNWKGYAAEDNPNSSPGLEMEPCGTPRESNAHAKSSAEFRHRNFNPKRDSSPVQLSGAGRGGWVEEDARYPESKNSTMGRCSEDSRAYLDSSRPSTLGRNDDKFDAKSAYLDSLGRGENATNEEEDEKEKLVAEDSTRRVSICRQNVGTLGGSPGTPAGKSPGKNYSAMAPGNRDVTVGNTSNGRYVDGNDARSAASRATATSAGNLATTNSGNGATVPRASVPSYFGGRFSTLAGVGFRSGAHNLNPVGDTNSTGASVVGANAGETNSEESGGTNTGARNTRINSGANNNTGINAGVNSFGTNCSGSTNLGINGSGVTNTGVTSLGGAANGHIAGGGTLNNGGNNHRRRNNGGPATATSQTSMPC